MKNYLKSQRHKELNERIKAANARRVAPVKDDFLDGLYNRPSPGGDVSALPDIKFEVQH